MELKEFVKTAITQISDGILEAKEEATGKGLLINPQGLAVGGKGDKYLKFGGWRYVQDIEFNVAVTATDEANAGGGIKVASILNIGGGVKETNSSISTINFKVPVAFPGDETPKQYAEKKSPNVTGGEFL